MLKHSQRGAGNSIELNDLTMRATILRTRTGIVRWAAFRNNASPGERHRHRRDGRIRGTNLADPRIC
jgi:hypothetical protein